MATISVIVPIYNQEFNSNIQLCIKSILAQTLSDFEIILVNDGSTDNSGILCDEYAKKDSRISVIHREHHDIGAARNTGILSASGDFITFVDCNDFLHEDMLEQLYKHFFLTDTDIVLCDFQPIEEGEEINESRRKVQLRKYDVTVYSGTEALHGRYDVDRLFSVPWSKMFRKEIFEIIKYPEGYVDEDEFIAHQLLFSARKVFHLHVPLYYYVIDVGRKGSVTPIPMTIGKFDKVLALYERAVFFNERNLRDVEERALLHFAEHFFWYYLQSQNELPEAVERRKEIKKLYNQLFFRLIGISQLSIKKKIVYLAFRINPSIHKLLLSRLDGRKVVKQA